MKVFYILQFKILITILIFLGSANANTNQPRSQYFQSSLSSEICTEAINASIENQADKTRYNALDDLLSATLYECGLSESENQIISEPISFEFGKFVISWNGKFIHFNKEAENEVIAIQRKDIILNKETDFMMSIMSKLDNVKQPLEVVKQEGKTHLLLPGYAYHSRRAYPNYKSLNEHAAGIGIEKSRINRNGNKESVSAMVFLDSHEDVQPTLSYEWQAPFKISKHTTFWAGYSAGITARSDLENYLPVPFVFPTMGLSIGKVSIKSVIIPQLGKDAGNVIFIFGSYAIE